MRKILRKVFRKHGKGSKTRPGAATTQDVSSEPKVLRAAAGTAILPADTLVSAAQTCNNRDRISENLWEDAYKILVERDKDLVHEYEKALGSTLDSVGESLSNPESVTKLVERLREEHDGKKLTFRFRGEEHKYRDQFNNIVKLAIFADSLVKQALATQPYAALAWTGVSILLPDKKRRIRQVTTGWTSWKDKACDIDQESDFCKNLLQPAQQNALESVNEAKLQRMNSLFKATRDIAKVMSENRAEDIEMQICENLKRVAGNYETAKNSNLERVRGTCEWFFSDHDFCNWRDGTDSGLFWVSADPGCGKSVLSRALIDGGHLKSVVSTFDMTSSVATVRERDNSVCYFFFKEDVQGRTRLVNAFSAILHELFAQDKTNQLIQHAVAHHKLNAKFLPEEFRTLWDILVAYSSSISGEGVICVLDALDECEREDRDLLMEKLQDYYTASLGEQKLKFFTTSRPYKTITRLFDRFSRRAKLLHLDGDDKHDEVSRDMDLDFWTPLALLLAVETGTELAGLKLLSDDELITPAMVTEEVLTAMVKNTSSGVDMLKFILTKYKDEVSIPQTLLEELVGYGYGLKVDVLGYLMNQRPDDFRVTRDAMDAAARNGRGDLLEYLCTRRHDGDVSGLESQWAVMAQLRSAARTGNLEETKVAMERGADVNSRSIDGKTALHEAAYQGHVDVVEFLLARPDMDVNAVDIHGRTPLHDCGRGRSRGGAAHMLLFEAVADPNPADKEGRTPLHMAIYHDDQYLVKLLIESGADVDRADDRGITPRMLAEHWAEWGDWDYWKMFEGWRVAAVFPPL